MGQFGRTNYSSSAPTDGFRKVNPIQYTTSQTNPPISGLVCPTIIYVSAAACANAKTFLVSELGIGSRNLKQDIGFLRLDYQLNSTNRISALTNFQNWGEPYGSDTRFTIANLGKGTNGTAGAHERFFIATWDSTISSDKLNELRFQWGRDFEFAGTNEPGPLFNVGNFVEYGETNSRSPASLSLMNNRYQISDNFTFIKGAHTFKSGVDLNFIHEYLINLFNGNGSYSYTAVVALPSNAGCVATVTNSQPQNTEFCDWLFDATGAVTADTRSGKHYSSFTQVNDPITHSGKDDFYDNDFGLYLEDTWKVRPNLTLNLGVRYDLQHVPPSAQPNTNTALTTFYTSTLNFDTNNIAPRIGVAWNFANNTVLRVGFGSFYGKTSNSTYYALRVAKTA